MHLTGIQTGRAMFRCLSPHWFLTFRTLYFVHLDQLHAQSAFLFPIVFSTREMQGIVGQASDFVEVVSKID